MTDEPHTPDQPQDDQPQDEVTDTNGAGPQTESLTIPCQCGMQYGFEVTEDTSEFTFICKACGTSNKWTR